MIREPDFVDGVIAELGRELPQLDTSPFEVGERIARIAATLRRRVDGTLAPTGIKSAGFGVLAVLRRSGPPYEMRPSDLSRATMLTSGAMTNRIDRLERSGLVERTGWSGEDRRTVVIRLTPSGKKLVEAAYSVYSAELGRLLQPLSKRESEVLTQALRKISHELGDVSTNGLGTG